MRTLSDEQYGLLCRKITEHQETARFSGEGEFLRIAKQCERDLNKAVWLHNSGAHDVEFRWIMSDLIARYSLTEAEAALFGDLRIASY